MQIYWIIGGILLSIVLSYVWLYWVFFRTRRVEEDAKEEPAYWDRHEEPFVPPIEIKQPARKKERMHFNGNVVDLDEWRKRA